MTDTKMKTKNINAMKTLIITIALVSFWGMSFATGENTFNPESINSTDQNIKIENWMLQSNYFMNEDDTMDFNDVSMINLEETKEEAMQIESWMLVDLSKELTLSNNEKSLKIENWMMNSFENESESPIKLENWMF
jgi:hypothetical protein